MLGKSKRLTGRARLSAKRNDRNGGMLLLVVIIMAIALILITSALTITTAARNRYYNSALTDQATITASSVVKTIGAAVEKGDITLTEIEGLAGANGGAGTVIPVTSATAATKTAGSAGSDKTKAAAPGLYGVASSSYTNVLVKYYTNSAGKKLIQIQATTGLDVNGAASTKTQTESVYLEKITPAPPAGAFSSLLMCGVPGSTNNFEMMNIGAVPGGQTVASNYVVINGNIGISNSGGSQNIFSDVIFTGKLETGAGNIYTGNIVFYGKTAGLDVVNSGGSGVTTTDMVLFLGGDPAVAGQQQSAFLDGSGNPATLNSSSNVGSGINGAAGIYFYNTIVNYDQNWDVMKSASGIYTDTAAILNYSHNYYDPNGGRVYESTTANATSYYTPSNTKILLSSRTGIYAPGGNDSAAFIKALKDEAARVVAATMKASITRVLPNPATSATFYTDYGIAYKTVAEVTAGAKELTAAELKTPGKFTKKDPAYYINVAAASYVGNGFSGTLDGICDTNYTPITEFVFDLSSNDITIYIYGNGNTLCFGSGLFRFINGGVHIGRIVLMDGCNIMMAKNNSGYDTGIIGTNHIKDPGNANKTIVDFAALPKPFLYIIGINNNKIFAQQNDIIEGYIGLYGIGGTFTHKNAPRFYGRIEATGIAYAGIGTGITISYCPSPTEDSGGGGGVASAYYQINGYQAA